MLPESQKVISTGRQLRPAAPFTQLNVYMHLEYQDQSLRSRQSASDKGPQRGERSVVTCAFFKGLKALPNRLARPHYVYYVTPRAKASLPDNQGMLFVALLSHSGLHVVLAQLKPSAESEYLELHQAVWPGVLATLEKHNITDYSIHYYRPLHLLVAHFKYVGADYAADMAAVAADPETRRWWKVTDALQDSFVEGATGSGGDVPWWTVSRLACFGL